MERRAVTRDYLFRAAREFTGVIRAELGEYPYFVSTEDSYVSKVVFQTGGFDRESMDQIVKTVAPDLSGRTVIDLGANIGTTTVNFVRRYGAAQVVAFEPDPANFKLLRHNLIENNIEDKVRAFCAAASDQSGSVPLRRDGNWGAHQVVSAETLAQGDIVDVPALTLDSVVERGDIDVANVGLLWMDIQGHEVHALVGARKLLEAWFPLVMEFWPKELRLAGRLSDLSGVLEPHYRRIIDFGPPDRNQGPRTLAIAELQWLIDRYPDGQFSDIAVVPDDSPGATVK